MIPDDEHKLIDDELEATGIPFSQTWYRIEIACKELRHLREVVANQKTVIAELKSRLFAAKKPHDLCAGRMVAVDDNVFRCVRCGNERTEYAPPSACGAAIYY